MNITTTTLSVQTITITPEYAEKLLGRNTHNRKVSPTNLARVKHALLRGEWKLNGEAIKIAADGRILDGQHRLLASVETGLSFETLVISGLDSETQNTMDTGKSRTLPDVLGLAGYGSASSLAATIAGVIRLQRHGARISLHASSAYPVSVTEAMARLQSEPSLEDLARETKKFGRIGLPGRVASVLYYYFSTIDATDADYFFEKLFAGDSLDRGNPILTLRNALIASKTTKGSANPVHLAAITIKAWNKYRAGESASILRFTPGGANPEAFPEAL